MKTGQVGKRGDGVNERMDVCGRRDLSLGRRIFGFRNLAISPWFTISMAIFLSGLFRQYPVFHTSSLWSEPVAAAIYYLASK